MRNPLWWFVLAAVSAPALTADVHSGQVPDLFVEVEPDPRPSPPEGRFLETFTVELDMEALRLPAQRLILNLPDREPEVVHLLRWQPRQGYVQILDPDDPTGLGTITIPDPNARPEDFSWRWYGKSDSYTVALTTVEGIVAGRIASAGFRYAVEPRRDQITKLGWVNSDFWRTHPPSQEKSQAQSSALTASAIVAPQVAAAPSDRMDVPAGGGWDALCSGPLPEGQHVIDVLLLYTTGILNEYGSVAGVEAILLTTVGNANDALRSSGIQNVVFSPRGPEFLPDPPIPPGYDQRPILNALDTAAGVERLDIQPIYLFPGNPYVAGRRNAMWADIVALARVDGSGEGACGVSYLNRVTSNNGYVTAPGPDFEKLAYIVFDPACDADRLNLAHELGHQLGLEHDPSNFDFGHASGQHPSCPWSYGHKRSSGDQRFRFRTVMAYWQDELGRPGGPPSCGSDTNCPQIDAFSTPLLEWAGKPSSGGPPPFELQPVGTVPGASPIGRTGVTLPQRPSNAVDTIKRIAPIVQAYRARPELIFANGFQ